MEHGAIDSAAVGSRVRKTMSSRFARTNGRKARRRIKKRGVKRDKVGRPLSFKPLYVDQVVALARLGATRQDMALFFHVNDSTIDRWIKREKAFGGALREGRIESDLKIANTLYRKALGFEWVEEKAVKVKNADGGWDVVVVPVRRVAQPDTTALIYWIKTRRPDLWSEKRTLELVGADGGPVKTESTLKVEALDDETLEGLLAAMDEREREKVEENMEDSYERVIH